MSLDVHGLGFGYGEAPVLDGVELRAAPGQVTAVLGPNGSGKSTLLRCVAGIERFRGRVAFDGEDLAAMAPCRRWARIGYMPQNLVAEAALSVFETVLVGLVHDLSWRVRRCELDRASAALDLVGMARLAERPIDRLSGGERQLVFLAQALVRQPRLLLLDEPTSNLDIRNSLEMLDLVRGITARSGLTTLIALHDLNLAAIFADSMVVLHQSRIHDQGAPARVLTPAALKHVYGIEAEVEMSAAGVPKVTPLRAV